MEKSLNCAAADGVTDIQYCFQLVHMAIVATDDMN